MRRKLGGVVFEPKSTGKKKVSEGDDGFSLAELLE